MYNLNSHYENIYHFLSSIVSHPRVLYLHPFGTTEPENIETLSKDISHISDLDSDPLFIFYDQEPIYGEFNFKIFDYIKDTLCGPYVLITTEKNSDAVKVIQERYGCPVVYYFHHIFAAHDWYRGYDCDARLIPPENIKIKKK